jgi:hypothetical protein
MAENVKNFMKILHNTEEKRAILTKKKERPNGNAEICGRSVFSIRVSV